MRAKIGGNLVLLLRNEGKLWYKVPCFCFLVFGYYYFLMGSGCLLIFLGGFWIVTAISGGDISMCIHTACGK